MRRSATHEPPGRWRWLLAVAAVGLVASIATTAAVPAAQQTKPPQPAANAAQGTTDFVIQNEEELATVGEEIVMRVCETACHKMENHDRRRPAYEWNGVIQTMIERGAMASVKDVAIIRQYMKRYDGVLAVNTAPAEEFSAVLGLSAKDAQAVIAYRTANGKFQDAEALARVPGIDKAKIEEQPDALIFR